MRPDWPDRKVQGAPPNGPAPAEAGPSRSQGPVENFRELLVAKAFNVAQDDDGAERLRHVAEGGLDMAGHLSMRGCFKGRLVVIDEAFEQAGAVLLSAGRVVGLDGDLALRVAGPPAALVQRF